MLLPTLNDEDDVYSRIVLNRFVQHFAADVKAPDTDCREWAGHWVQTSKIANKSCALAERSAQFFSELLVCDHGE